MAGYFSAYSILPNAIRKCHLMSCLRKWRASAHPPMMLAQPNTNGQSHGLPVCCVSVPDGLSIIPARTTPARSQYGGACFHVSPTKSPARWRGIRFEFRLPINRLPVQSSAKHRCQLAARSRPASYRSASSVQSLSDAPSSAPPSDAPPRARFVMNVTRKLWKSTTPAAVSTSIPARARSSRSIFAVSRVRLKALAVGSLLARCSRSFAARSAHAVMHGHAQFVMQIFRVRSIRVHGCAAR